MSRTSAQALKLNILHAQLPGQRKTFQHQKHKIQECPKSAWTKRAWELKKNMKLGDLEGFGNTDCILRVLMH